MKTLLQTEARTISNAELAENQKYLIDLLVKIGFLKPTSNKNNQIRNNCHEKTFC
jgi:hypothetical protein